MHTVDRQTGTSAGICSFALFSYGFRPFFLLAGVSAALLVPAWICVYLHGAVPLPNLPPQYWHGHEMIFGFLGAAIAGFLLTAIPSWTGSRGFAGTPLILLVTLWLAGRVAMAGAVFLPEWLVIALELSFLPALCALLAPPLLRSTNRNTPMLLVLGVFWLADLAFIIAMHSNDTLLAQRALRLAIDIVLILVTVIGGRIVPAFTSSALRRHGGPAQVVSRRWLEPIVIALMVAIAVVDVVHPDSMMSGVLAAFAAAAHALRLAGWRGRRTLREPILWVLHIGYAWLPIGLGLKSLWLLANVSWSAHWLHAFTMGVFGTMILAVMTRASLGHTGRPLIVSRATAVSYFILTDAVIVRVFGALLLDYRATIVLAGSLWTLAFALFLFIYAPILWRPRADGKSG